MLALIAALSVAFADRVEMVPGALFALIVIGVLYPALMYIVYEYRFKKRRVQGRAYRQADISLRSSIAFFKNNW